ncbi:hypothetical protein, partial [Cupriavidus numazuensis]|uniref:hypothetical protein n=1 Tax=Cupriavidus numazuensis TaxID=221992 RepID=UPI0036229908
MLDAAYEAGAGWGHQTETVTWVRHFSEEAFAGVLQRKLLTVSVKDCLMPALDCKTVSGGGACGQASNNPRGRKPRDAAMWFAG